MLIKDYTQFADGAFVARGENLVLLGSAEHTYALIWQIMTALKNQGQTVRFLDTSKREASVKPLSPTLNVALLVIWQLPRGRSEGDLTPPSEGNALATALKLRAEKGLSTIIASSDSPSRFVSHNMLGSSTFHTAAAIGMGLLLSTDGKSKPYLERINVPDAFSQDFWVKHNVAPISWITDERLKQEYFGKDGEPRLWNWLDMDVLAA